MPQLKEIIEKIDLLKSRLDGLRPLKKDDEDRLWKKFRLEWNYNSNHIEGNTLTYGQTELLLIFGKTTGDHEMREYQEMKAHDAAVKLVDEYAADKNRNLVEADIREFNKIILVEPYWGNAQTHDGQPTKKLIRPGEYKREPNSVLLQNGEMFHYASPDETQARMGELMMWLSKVTSENRLHPVVIAAQLHYDFVRIHPFDDSNGRTSRLLMNYIFLRYGYPPVIIKTEDKKGYLAALNKADVGDLDSFIQYIGEQLIWSLKINIIAGQGGNIEEEEDLDKEIQIWKKSLNRSDLERPTKSFDYLKIFFGDSLLPIFERYVTKHSEFNLAFVNNNIDVFFSSTGKTVANLEDLRNYLWERITALKGDNPNFVTDDLSLSIRCEHLIHKQRPDRKSYFYSSLDVEFLPLVVKISHNVTGEKSVINQFYYSQRISEAEIKDIIRKIISKDLEWIKLLEK